MRIAVCDTKVDAELLTLAAQIGVEGYVVALPEFDSYEPNGAWSVGELKILSDQCATEGVALLGIENVPYGMFGDIITGGPQRDRQLEAYATTVENLGAAGIGVLGFYFAADGVWRTSFDAKGRGGARVSEFRLEEARRVGNQIARSPRGPVIDERSVWRNYEIFLREILPVAEQAGVRLAHHPDDPPVPLVDRSARIFHSLDSFKRAQRIAGGSTAWGLELCLGAVAEMATGPQTVFDFIDHFGSTDDIVYVHMRNVRGTVPDFVETFIEEGDFSVPDAIRALASVGFKGWLQDDHVPSVGGDSAYGHRARCHAIGFMQGVMRSIELEGGRP